MVLPILQDGAEVLREVSKPVPQELFGTPELKSIIENMADSMDREPDGVAIAAPQIGIPYRIFLVRYDRMVPKVEGEPEHAPDVGVFINPSLSKMSRKTVECDEGCLSVRGIYGKTLRRERATVAAYDADGKPFSRGGGGILAQAFQHEIEHLNGILFVDVATTLFTLTIPESDA